MSYGIFFRKLLAAQERHLSRKNEENTRCTQQPRWTVGRAGISNYDATQPAGEGHKE